MFSWVKGSFRAVLSVLVLLVCSFSVAQTKTQEPARLRITADSQLSPTNSEIELLIRPLDRVGPEKQIRFQIPGDADVQLAPGRYQLSSKRAVNSGAGWLMWDLEVPVSEGVSDVRLTEQNAILFTDLPDLAGEQTSTRPTRQGSTSESDGPPKQASVPPSENPPPHVTAPPSTAERRTEVANPDQQTSLQSPVDLSSPRTSTERAVVQLLNDWVSAVREHDINQLMACYAPRLSRYFLKENVSSALVRRDKENFFRRYPSIKKLELRDVRIYPTTAGADVTLTKSWEFSGTEPFSGEVVSSLKLQNINGKWAISSERERGIWVSRSPDRAIIFVKVKPSR